MYDQKNNISIYLDEIDPKLEHQIYEISKHIAIVGRVAIMPDAHPNTSGSVVGFTAKFGDYVIPTLVGNDIGCGITTYATNLDNVNLEALDIGIRNSVPIGVRIHKNQKKTQFDKEVKGLMQEINEFQKMSKSRYERDFALSLCTLGGGNHFIELNKDSDGRIYITVHTGSRILGEAVAKYYQYVAKQYGSKNKIPMKEGLEYMSMQEGGYDYIRHIKMAQRFASLNRIMIIEAILSLLKQKLDSKNFIESSHNYIDDDLMVRKGAISAKKDETIIVALNMAEGIIIAKGLGNPDFNFSAPHGLGRKYTRSQMRMKLLENQITMDEYREKMKYVYSTSVSQKTICESPQAYKSFSEVKNYLEKTAIPTKILKPIYNLKA